MQTVVPSGPLAHGLCSVGSPWPPSSWVRLGLPHTPLPTGSKPTFSYNLWAPGEVQDWEPNEALGQLLGCLQSTFVPAGANGQVSYGGLSGGPFSIHPETGLIVTTRPLDREEQEQHVLTGKQGEAGGQGGHSGTPCCWPGERCRGQAMGREGGGAVGHSRAVGWFGAAGMLLFTCLAAPVGAWVMAHGLYGCSSQSASGALAVLQSMRGTPACRPASPRPRCGSPWAMRMTMHPSWRGSPAPWRFLRTRVGWHSTPCGPLILMVGRTDAWSTGWQVRCTGSVGLGKDFSLGFPGSGDISCSIPIPY